jgi:hypothetical protein
LKKARPRKWSVFFKMTRGTLVRRGNGDAVFCPNHVVEFVQGVISIRHEKHFTVAVVVFDFEAPAILGTLGPSNLYIPLHSTHHPGTSVSSMQSKGNLVGISGLLSLLIVVTWKYLGRKRKDTPKQHAV